MYELRLQVFPIRHNYGIVNIEQYKNIPSHFKWDNLCDIQTQIQTLFLCIAVWWSITLCDLYVIHIVNGEKAGKNQDSNEISSTPSAFFLCLIMKKCSNCTQTFNYLGILRKMTLNLGFKRNIFSRMFFFANKQYISECITIYFYT